MICAFLVGVSSTEEQKVIRRRKIISDVEPLVNKKIYSQLLDAQESKTFIFLQFLFVNY